MEIQRQEKHVVALCEKMLVRGKGTILPIHTCMSGFEICGVCVNSSIVDEGAMVKRKTPCKIEGRFIPIRLY